MFTHWLPAGRTKEFFFTVDQIAIFMLIAGTYTPLALIMKFSLLTLIPQPMFRGNTVPPVMPTGGIINSPDYCLNRNTCVFPFQDKEFLKDLFPICLRI
jgi:hypothetical protein